MTVEEAKTKTCPFSRQWINPQFGGALNCLADQCMMWRWHTSDGRPWVKSTTDGDCGMKV